MSRLLIFFLILFLGITDASPSPVAKRQRQTATEVKTAVESLKAAVDSVDWLRERYCDMLAYDRSRADKTISDLQRNFKKLPYSVQDSMLASHYDAIVKLFEQERNARAYAFADCYYALADKDDVNLGNLYLNDIVLAIEQEDTVKLRQRMTQLKEYGNRNNYDFSEDLADAEINMDLCRRRIKFKETPVDRFAGRELWVLDFDYKILEKEEQLLQYFLYIPGFVQLERYGNNARIQRYSLDGKFKKKGDMYIMEKSQPEAYAHDTDHKSKTFYCVWGYERTRSANPRLLAGGRQLVQNTHADVAGELSRKKYSYGQRLAGNAAATLVDAGLNALFDWLSVTTEFYYRCELSLTLTKPDVLEGVISIETTKVKSNDLDHPETHSATIPLKYLRSYPEYGYCFMRDGKPVAVSAMTQTEFKTQEASFKQEIKMHEEPWKEYLRQWKAEHNGQKPVFEKLEDQYNFEMMNQLREKATNSLKTHPSTQP